MPEKKEIKIITTHHEAHRDYFIIETYEAGMVLVGCEVKSLRESKASLAGSFARFEGAELFLFNLYIAPYTKGSVDNEEPMRPRKLLLHHSQLLRLKAKTQEKGLALIPLKMYFTGRGVAKIDLAVCRGKNLYDKRTDVKKQTIKREIDRAIKNRNRRS